MVPPDRRDRFQKPGPPAVAFYPWLLIATGAVLSVIRGHARPAWAAWAGLAVFAILYMAAIWMRISARRQRDAVILLCALAAVTLALTIGYGGDMFALCPLLSVVCGAVVSGRLPRPTLVIAGVTGTALLIAWAHHASGGDLWQILYGTFVSGFIVAVVLRLVAAIEELQQTRLELARAAVDEERLRFARDLHDLLGHTLSVMVIKAQAVRKLAPRDPEQAAAQAADIEAVGRQALTEVRESVHGYRGRGIARELDEARTALADAGFTVTVQQDDHPLSAETDALLGWVIREGVTNVVRHSGGHQCQIDIRSSGGQATVEIRDDGRGRPAVRLPSGGHGLDGLRERIAAAGGTMDAGPRPGGGYRLMARVPVQIQEAANQ